jgi:hypothetical protein
MRPMRKASLVFWLLVLLLPGIAGAQQVYEFTASDVRLEVLPAEVFQAQAEANPEIPLTDEAILALALKLYPPLGQKPLRDKGRRETCGEHELGLLYASLQNPAISDLTRSEVDSIIAAALPPLPQTYEYGDFKFFYTSDNPDPDHNVSDLDIHMTATALASMYEKYTRDFREPKHATLSGGRKRIGVKVYYMGEDLLGSTFSRGNTIDLNSKLTVRDPCYRMTVSAHELFHRVQYSYDYVSGTPGVGWFVEGCATWAQKYANFQLYHVPLKDYVESMADGLYNPRTPLLTMRTYDAAHFWVYLHERTNAWKAIEEVWARYRTNGKDPVRAVNSVVRARLGWTFQLYVQEWLKANYLKILPHPGAYDYDEDGKYFYNCGRTYFLPNVLNSGACDRADNKFNASWVDWVHPYAANYYDFKVGTALTDLRIVLDGRDTGNFSYHFIPLKDGIIQPTTDTNSTDYTYHRTLAPGQWDRLVLVVTGRDKGGWYHLRVGPCVTGTWQEDSFPYQLWKLTQNDTSITGTMRYVGMADTVFQVTGSYDPASRQVDLRAVGDGWAHALIVSARMDLTWNHHCSLMQGQWWWESTPERYPLNNMHKTTFVTTSVESSE